MIFIGKNLFLVLRPAEIAVIVLTFAEYSIQPLMPVLGMTNMSLDDQQKVIKLIALLGLGNLIQSKRKIVRLTTCPLIQAS